MATLALLSSACLVSQAASASVLPSWTDLFSGLKPFRTEEEEEMFERDDESQARFGFVSLNSGTSTFNTTLNLTGHIILGLGLASALLLWTFINAFDSLGGSGGRSHDGGDRRKRDTSSSPFTWEDLSHFVPPLLSRLEDKLRLAGLEEEECWTLATCEANRKEEEGERFGFGTVGNAARQVFRMVEDHLHDRRGPGDPILEKHLRSMSLGNQGKDCKNIYAKCKEKYTDVVKVLMATS